MEFEEAALELVVARLKAMPPNVKFSVGNHGTYSRDQLITAVKQGSPIGQAMVQMQLNYLRKMPGLSENLI